MESTTILEGEPQPTPSTFGADILVEDIFPPLALSEEQKEEIADWFDNDLKRCVRHVNSHIDKWETYRQLYIMNQIDPIYPDFMKSNFPSGLICEKVNEGMDRMKRAVFAMFPMFTVDMDASKIHDVNVAHRLELFMDDMMRNILKIKETLGNEALFEFLLDGSLIVETGIFFEVFPRKTIKIYKNEMELKEDAVSVVDQSILESAYAQLAIGKPVRLLVESQMEEHHGLRLFVVNKKDHLVPPNIYRDENIRFRALRLYYTETDMRVMASDSVGFWKREDVERVIRFRENGLGFAKGGGSQDDFPNFDRMKPEFSSDEWIGYSWDIAFDRSDELREKGSLPYSAIYPVYRITAYYGYSTPNDPHGLIPKLCVFDYDFDSRTILRARVYPHTRDILPWIHFKLGYRPKSYYGMGFGALLQDEDVRQSNILNLFLDTTAIASFPPSIGIHPEYGGLTPFRGGAGPGQHGYVRSLADFKYLEVPSPSQALVSILYPISLRNAENRSGITGYVMGQTESTDPRSPAQKTAMLLGQAQISMESILDDFSKGLVRLAVVVQHAIEIIVVIQGYEMFGNVVEQRQEMMGAMVTLDELELPIRWISQASALAINPEHRKNVALRHFSFFAPILQQLGNINPQLFMKYFIRWMQYMAAELELRNSQWLIPSEVELEGAGVPMTQALGEISEQLKMGEALPPPQAPEEAVTEPTEETLEGEAP